MQSLVFYYPSGNIFPFLSPPHIGNSCLAITIWNSNLVIKHLLSETLTVLMNLFQLSFALHTYENHKREYSSLPS